MIAAPLFGRRGAAAVEMALVAPILLLLLFGAAETGHYFYYQHVLTKAVRDGAIYASRQPIIRDDGTKNFDCAAGTINQSVIDNTRAVVATGALSGGAGLVKQWDYNNNSYKPAVTMWCRTVVGGTTLGGIYTANGGNVPVVKVSATVPYRAITGGYIFNWTGYSIHADQQAVVMGI